ncbi:UNKNOWN [Stylonychia lemnae]|uniref:PHR domain-containing protein n=1 Tax=Stylonychia lemnae TaxID=5949 RepID=A0A078BA12_STYLE|nr:UNKNOWN [Stylonychia lemnae]|eukprot:CDW91259.1 UNKNOWN [Stylonychia lemnae]
MEQISTSQEETIVTEVQAAPIKSTLIQAPTLWRETQGDGAIAVRNFNYEVKELDQASLKDAKFDIEKIVTSEINRFVETYNPKQTVYHLKSNQYVQIKKVDEARKMYVCRPKQEKQNEGENTRIKDDQDIEVPFDEISEQIQINLRIITEDQTCVGQVYVGINDKIKTLKDFLNSKSASLLNIVFKDEIIKNDDTFLKRHIRSGEKFILMSGGFEAKIWKRFRRIEHGDYFYMSDTYYDAVCFKPKKACHFLGFGFLNQYEKKDFKLKFKYYIDDEEFPETEVDLTQDMLGEHHSFKIDFQTLNLQPITVKPDQMIHICARVQLTSPMRFIYGYDSQGTDGIEGQDPDFAIQRSSRNQNSTGSDFGQFSYILYAL